MTVPAQPISHRKILMFRTTPPSVYWLALGAFALGMASFVTAGLIPMIGQAFNVEVAVAAQLVTVFSLAYGIGSPVVVALLPAHRQRFAMLAALAVFLLANVASALVDDFVALLVSRAFAGLGAGVYLATAIAASSAVALPGQRGRAIAMIMTGMAAGTVLGVPCSLLLAERAGWQAALWLIALLAGGAWLGLACSPVRLAAGPQIAISSRRLLLSDRKVMSILLVSLLAAVSSLGMYTFIAPLLGDPEFGGIDNIAPWLWAWGLGGVAGSFLIAPLAERIEGPLLTLIILLILATALLLLPLAAALSPWLAMLAIALWGCVGWALQVPQNNRLIAERQAQGDSNLAVALNESALYLGSALGAGAGGLLLALPVWTLALSAGAVALLAALVQFSSLRIPSSEALETGIGNSK